MKRSAYILLLALTAVFALHVGALPDMPHGQDAGYEARRHDEARLTSRPAQRRGEGELTSPVSLPASLAARTRRGSRYARLPRTMPPAPAGRLGSRQAPSSFTASGGAGGHGGSHMATSAARHFSPALLQHINAQDVRRETSPYACQPASDYYVYALRHILR